MDLRKISKDINSQLNNYEIGKIQQFRVKAKKLSRPKSYNFFPDEPINENWTFHIGGRTELQFNIGNEDEGLRFGFAFSLEPSRSLRNCVRDAFGQLLDYCCYADVRNASKLFVVGEPELDSATKEYLEFVNKEFNIPIGYLRIEL